jgi:hypothetical protein
LFKIKNEEFERKSEDSSFLFYNKRIESKLYKNKVSEKKSHNTQYKEAEISTTKKFRFGIKNH